RAGPDRRRAGAGSGRVRRWPAGDGGRPAMTTTTPTTTVNDQGQAVPRNDSRADKVEDTVKLVVLVAIMGAALAASFTHMKDWTLHWMPEGTPEWFGWANAVISELLPLVATLSLRKRLRQGKKLV